MTSVMRPRPPLGGVFTMPAGAGIPVRAPGISQGIRHDAVGPATMPRIIAPGLISGGGRELPVVVISGALLLAAVGMGMPGWAPVAAMIFFAAAYAFGGRRLRVCVPVGLIPGAA